MIFDDFLSQGFWNLAPDNILPHFMYKIILDCDLMRYPDSGLYHYCLNLGNFVNRELQKENKGCISFYIPPGEKESFENNASCITERKWHQKYFKPFFWDCNIWHAPFQSGRIIVPPRKKNIKVLLTIHDLNCLHEDKSQTERSLSLQKTQKLINRCDAMVCISEHCKNDVVSNLEINHKPVYVIHNGTHNVVSPPRVPAGYDPKRPFIFTMGYVNRKKNFHTLIPLLKNPELELVIAGKLDDPEYVHYIRAMAMQYGVAERLHILGPVSEEDKAWYLNHCLAFMLPSLAEGFGAPVVEAMKFGKPIFLSALTSLPEIGGDIAFYFNHFDPGHMCEVFNEGMYHYQKNGLAEKIIKRGNNFNWEKSAKQYTDVYQSLL